MIPIVLRLLELVLVLRMALMPTFASSETRPAPPSNDEFPAQGHSGWAVDARSGCRVWNANPPSERLSW